jgi:hypothetical protein
MDTRRERRSPWYDQSATHPSQKAAKDGAPTVWFAIGKLGHPPEFPTAYNQSLSQLYLQQARIPPDSLSPDSPTDCPPAKVAHPNRVLEESPVVQISFGE